MYSYWLYFHGFSLGGFWLLFLQFKSVKYLMLKSYSKLICIIVFHLVTVLGVHVRTCLNAHIHSIWQAILASKLNCIQVSLWLYHKCQHVCAAVLTVKVLVSWKHRFCTCKECCSSLCVCVYVCVREGRKHYWHTIFTSVCSIQSLQVYVAFNHYKCM